MDKPERFPKVELVREELIYENTWYRIYFDHVRFPNGVLGRYTKVTDREHGPAVVVLPLSPSGDIGMVRIYRYPVADWIWELPRGGGHSGGWQETVAAELEEELGCRAGRLEHIGQVASDTGILGSPLELILALDVTPTGRPMEGDQGTIVETRFIPQSEVSRMVRDGEIRCGVTMASLLIASLKGHIRLG